MQPAAKILIVDDEPAAILVMHKTLHGMGELRYARGGQEALELVASDPPDLILLDAIMPDMDGFATCAALRRIYPDIPVVFVTAAGDFANEIHALEAGASDFLPKPINPPVVRARVAMHLKFKAQNDLLRDLCNLDPLTGVANRRALEERLTLEWRRAARHRLPLSLLMIDVDHFKAYNDHYGPVDGDACLERLAQTLTQTIARADDLVARYGGEKFAALLAGTGLDGALALAEKVLAAVRALAIPHARSSVSDRVSLSIGVASLQPVFAGESAESGRASQTGAAAPSVWRLCQELLERADQALDAAQAQGRDRIGLAGEGPHACLAQSASLG